MSPGYMPFGSSSPTSVYPVDIAHALLTAQKVREASFNSMAATPTYTMSLSEAATHSVASHGLQPEWAGVIALMLTAWNDAQEWADKVITDEADKEAAEQDEEETDDDVD